MRLLIAPDSFKDSLPAPDACRAIAAGLRIAHPQAALREFPLADGGEGALEILAWHLPMQLVTTDAVDALGRPLRAAYGITDAGKTAVIEMATASGLQLLSASERNPSLTSTLGSGLMIKNALARGVERIVLAIGGSATNDAGTGIAAALGWQFLDRNAEVVPATGGRLIDIDQVIAPAPATRSVTVDVMCDVDNPLYGPQGAAWIYAAQKGANDAMMAALDDGLRNLAQRMQRVDAAAQPGAGAAGGLGFGAMVFMNATLHRGIDVIMDLTRFDDALADADVVICGEGHLDAQTLHGKLIHGICRRASRFAVPVIALCGRISATREQIAAIGLRDAVCINEPNTPLEQALRQTAANLTRTAAGLALG